MVQQPRLHANQELLCIDCVLIHCHLIVPPDQRGLGQKQETDASGACWICLLVLSCGKSCATFEPGEAQVVQDFRHSV